MKIVYFLIAILVSFTISHQTSFAQINEDPEIMFNIAKEHFVRGEYKEAVSIYDEILEIAPNNISTLKMKGIAQSNLEQHTSSLKQFFKVLQYKPDDIISLTGMGVGFGYLGEYQESIAYFEKASMQKPSSVVINNYKEFINKVITKYPYTPTEKPKTAQTQITSIPEWIKPIAKWWSEETIEDSEFNSALVYLIKNKIIQIPPVDTLNQSNEQIPNWIRNNAGWWADGQIDDEAFVQGIQYLISNGIISVNVEEPTKSQEELEQEFYLFEKYLRDISNNISKEKRYIEYPNPSQDVIKKFLRDYVKWNFEEQVKKASEKFPDPTYQIEDDTYIINYKVYINEQPTGLPLDHVSTLSNSFEFWENQELTTNEQKAKIQFEITDLKHEANVWVTWVVRDIGEGVLGHAHLGKGVVEVTLGDYNCDGSFQLYDVNSVETIMTHELGHSIGLKHVNDKNNIMFPSFTPSYAYCLLS
ncbi:M57 family metalloprotease [Nitrosopumilus sp.]|uniref:M57 family metalloprotease n=1 Tax=Nitrosopumilus sp. TaxID=2024843 RepID=UPI00247D8A19|nr:M57 family metalloprotease [Nitrosopumilus sp.]MCV0430268.1 matrixin family metalloprotease [Nitrosopumilus sp.]